MEYANQAETDGEITIVVTSSKEKSERKAERFALNFRMIGIPPFYLLHILEQLLQPGGEIAVIL